jgi:hypothetical protein
VASQDSSSYPGRPHRRGRGDDDELVFANSQDFFSSLPHQPAIPTRIEPRDVITQMEDLTVIRKKFQALAEDAKRKGKPLLLVCARGTVMLQLRYSFVGC